MDGEDLCRMKAGITFIFAVVLSSIANIGLKKKVLLCYHLYVAVLRKKSDLCHPDWSRSKISVAW